ncbi:hypothetical protein NEIPOLOT_00852 [Neisseria polysaccharea ATCC 43768]|nr:hypothetical protein NEIPOLOT_00852 [Neisseria polysaccharea ATCC 43768]
MGGALKRTNMPSEPSDGIPKTKQSREKYERTRFRFGQPRQPA